MLVINEDAIRVHVREILLDLAPVKGPQDKLDLDLEADLGYNSLALLEAIVIVEDELGLTLVDDGSAKSIRTVADIQDYVVRLAQNGDR